MDQNVFAGRWHLLRDRVRLEWGKLTDDDLKEIGGQMDKLIRVIMKRYGYSHDMARDIVDNWIFLLRV